MSSGRGSKRYRAAAERLSKSRDVSPSIDALLDKFTGRPPESTVPPPDTVPPDNTVPRETAVPPQQGEPYRKSTEPSGDTVPHRSTVKHVEGYTSFPNTILE